MQQIKIHALHQKILVNKNIENTYNKSILLTIYPGFPEKQKS